MIIMARKYLIIILKEKNYDKKIRAFKKYADFKF